MVERAFEADFGIRQSARISNSARLMSIIQNLLWNAQ
jgi:hypothetical protein